MIFWQIEKKLKNIYFILFYLEKIDFFYLILREQYNVSLWDFSIQSGAQFMFLVDAVSPEQHRAEMMANARTEAAKNTQYPFTVNPR